jgi:CubicO group peptidase (beta-lactamase class C family)
MRKFSSLVVTCVAIAMMISPAFSRVINDDVLFEEFDELVEKTMARWEVPGVAIAVVKDGEVAHMKGYGYRNVEKELEVNPQTLFRIGSTTKSFTAMAVGLLVDEGKLEWDKPVQD